MRRERRTESGVQNRRKTLRSKTYQKENHHASTVSVGFCRGHARRLEALAASGQHAAQFLTRHVSGDWGEVLCEEDRQLNDEALLDGSRLFSAYRTSSGEKIWIITEADRSSTCLLLPEEY